MEKIVACFYDIYSLSLQFKLFISGNDTLIFLVIILLLNTAAYCTSDSVVNYHSNGKIESVIHFSNGIRDGYAVFYHPNGNIKRELTYANGIVDGTVKEYSEQGTLKELYVIVDGKRDGPTSYFDDSGVYVEDRFFVKGKLQKVIDERYAPPLPPSEPKEITKNEEVKTTPPQKPKPVDKKKTDSDNFGLPVEIKNSSLDDDPAYYFEVEVMPEPTVGWNAFYDRLVYPEEAQKKGIAGEVILRAYINRYGDVEKTEVIQGLPFGCTDAAEILVYYTKFSPGLLKGKKVNVQMEITLTFSKK